VQLLVTRPEPDGARTAAALHARGHDVVLAPLLRMEPIACEIPDKAYGAVVMTSANAARAVAIHPGRDALMALPAFTVGGRSAQAARDAGFGDVRSADGDKADLVALIRAQYADRRSLLYLAGEERAGELDPAAVDAPVEMVVIYRAVALERFPPEIAAALSNGALDGVLHFSRRAAEAYLACATHAGIRDRALALVHFCLSRQVTEPLAAAGAPVIRIASHPDEAAMLELIGAT
jgi:uroporphyrinogen-III synthase